MSGVTSITDPALGPARAAGLVPPAAAGERVAQAGEPRSVRVESLRALAALSVLVSHAFVYSYGLGPGASATFAHRVAIEAGFGGVDVFFVLSGYLLFWPFARAGFSTGERVQLRRYARNRLLRILPLYYVVVAVLLLAQHGGGSGSQWWHFLLFAQNFSGATVGTLDAPMWSLAIEAQFYLTLPALAWLIVRISRGSRRRALSILLLLAAGSIVLRELTVWHSAPPLFAWQFSLPSVFFFFAAGMALALLRLGWELRAPARRTRLARTHSDLLVLVSLPLWLLVCWRFSLEPLAAVAGALLVAACVLPLRRGGFARVCETWALSRIGLASYSLYLWHVPVLIALSAGSVTVADAALSPHTGHFVALALGGGAVALALAALSYALVEAPPLRWRRGWASSAASSGSR